MNNRAAGGLRLGRAEIPTDNQPDPIEYGSFASPSEFADFELKVAGTSFFVNPWYLAEKSPVFAALCFSKGFKEREKKFATIQEEKSADILELLQCICPGSRFLTPKPVTAANFGLLIRLADKFDLVNLKAACEKYLNEEFDYIDAEPTHVIEMLLAADQFQLAKSAVAKLIARAATFDINTLKAHDVHKNLSNFVVAALFTANGKYSSEMENKMPLTSSQRMSSGSQNSHINQFFANSHNRRHQHFPDPSHHADTTSAQVGVIGCHNHLIHKTETGEVAKFYVNCSVCANNNGRGTANRLCLKCCQVLCALCETQRKCPNLVLTPVQIACLRNKMPSAEIDLSMLE